MRHNRPPKGEASQERAVALARAEHCRERQEADGLRQAAQRYADQQIAELPYEEAYRKCQLKHYMETGTPGPLQLDAPQNTALLVAYVATKTTRVQWQHVAPWKKGPEARRCCSARLEPLRKCEGQAGGKPPRNE